MDARGVLVKPRRDLMLGFFDRIAVDVIDLLADLVVAEAIGAAGKREIVSRDIERRAGFAQDIRLDRGRQARHVIAGRGRRFVAFAHHHPAHIFEHRRAVLLVAGGAHIDDAGLAAGIFLQPDDFGQRGQRIARIDGLAEITAGIAEIGDGVERNVGHGLAEHDVEHQQIVDRRARIADRFGERVRRLHREPRAEQAGVKRDVADRDGARRGVADHLADAEIFKTIAGAGLCHFFDRPCLSGARPPGAFHTPHAATGKAFTQP